MPANQSDRLTITNRPWGAWLMGSCFTAVGLFMALEIKDAPLFGLIFVAAGLAILLGLGRVTSLTLDRPAGTATLREVGVRRSSRVVPLADLCGAVVESARSSNGGASYRLSLVLRSGAFLSADSGYGPGWKAKNGQVERINDFLGTDDARPADAFGNIPGARREGVTDGVAWQVDARLSDTSRVTRWHTEGAWLQGGFLLVLLTQVKVPGLGPGKGLVASLARHAYEWVMSAYGFDTSEIPDLSQAVSVEGQGPGLVEHFATFTTQPEGARRWLSAEVCRLLVDWAERHPVSGSQQGGMSVLTAPRGLWVSFIGAGDKPGPIEDMTRLGVTLVRAQAAAESAGQPTTTANLPLPQ
jgi:hypothetical protein